MSTVQNNLRVGGVRRWLNVRSFIIVSVAAVLAFFILYPLLTLLESSFLLSLPGEPPAYGLEGWYGALTQRGVLDALFNTVTLSLTAVAIAIVVATFLAWALARTDIPAAKWLEFALWIGFFLPALPVVLGWILAFDPDVGLVNTMLVQVLGLEHGPFNIYSWWGIVWAHLTSVLVSVMVMIMTPAFRNLDATYSEASIMCGASGASTTLRIVLPLMAPAILLAVLFTTIRLFETFEVELILGLPSHIDVYSTKIYRLIVAQSPPQYSIASALGVLILIAMAPMVMTYNRFVAGRSHATVSGKYRAGRTRLGKWRWPIFAGASLIVATGTVIPLSFLVLSTFMQLFGFFDIPNAWTLDHWKTIFHDSQFFSSLKNTMIIAGGTALTLVIGCSCIAYFIVRKRGSAARLLNFLTWVPFMLPGVLLSLGLFWMFLRIPFLTKFYGTEVGLIAAMVIAQMTIGVQISKTVITQISTELEEASWMAGAGPWQTIRWVILPLLAPAFATVVLISFAATARDISHVILLSTSETQPLSLLQLQYVVEGRYEAAGVIGFLTVLITIAVALALRYFGGVPNPK